MRSMRTFHMEQHGSTSLHSGKWNLLWIFLAILFGLYGLLSIVAHASHPSNRIIVIPQQFQEPNHNNICGKRLWV